MPGRCGRSGAIHYHMKMLRSAPRGRVAAAAVVLPARPFTALARARLVKTRSSAEKRTAGINEDVLARLKAAEDEAAMLRRQLAAAQQGVLQDDIIQAKPKRVDSVDNRETVFDVTGKKGSASSWLSEADVDFFTGGAPGETISKDVVDPETQAILQKRLVIGGVLTLALGAFGLIPTEQLRFKPSKPLYFYIVPLLRIKDLLAECKPLIEDADWATLRILLARVSGPPNNAKENLDNIVALLEDRRTAEMAQQLSSEFFEYYNSIDYNKYFDAIPNRALSGSEVAQFSEFSGKALKAAQGRLDALLALLPAQARADALAQTLMY